MIKYITGNIFDAQTIAIVNAVNTVGVMGKGIALQFKNKYPHNYEVYRTACKQGDFKIGQVLIVKEGDLFNQKIIVNFPTKSHWRNPSQYEYIQSGLKALVVAITEHDLKSIAIPALGCGHGGLDWVRVKALVEAALSSLACDVFVYLPYTATYRSIGK